MIELDKKFNPVNASAELDENLLKSLPLPIYDAYKLIEGQTDYEKSLQILCLSLIPWTYQYTALIMSGEYLECTHEPSFEVTDNLLNMVKRPGPGKWIGFTRVAAEYFSARSTSVISPQTISTLNEIMNSKSRPHVKLFETGNKLEYSDALINIRNRFAHSRTFTPEKAKELFLDYFQVWKAWIVLTKDLFIPRLLFWSAPANSVQSLDNRPLEISKIPAKPHDKTTLLWNEETNAYLKLHPIIVALSDASKPEGEVAFLEEIKNKYLFYLNGDNFFKLKDEFEILSEKLESKTIVEETVAAENLTLKTFADRIDRITNQTITSFQDALKYIPEMYMDRPAISNKLDSWVESSLPGCIVAGNPGTGKTSIITNWCLQWKSKGDHVLLFEASSLKDSDITMIIEKELNLASPLKDCLDTIQMQNTYPTGDQKPKKFIVVVDAINEFIGTNNENRSRLWREINSLISILNLYNPWMKCLVTTRSDLWSTDFPGKDGAFDLLKDKYYWGDKEEGFPRIALGDLAQTEAGEIFEKARATIPSMAVQSSFHELSDKTQKVLCNPFLLRLALLAYNGKKISNLSKSKIERQFAKEKITEEKDKKTVLFALLERMSELRKTEVTFDEFLQVDTKVKPKKKLSKKEKLNLEKLIYDPRPLSPYKKLIKEGMIEERTDDSRAESKEKIKFSQEKISDIIYAETKRKALKSLNIITVFLVIVLIGFWIGMSFDNSNQNEKKYYKLQTELEKNIENQDEINNISNISYDKIKRNSKAIYIRLLLFISFIIFLPIAFIYITIYLQLFIVRKLKSDLASRFLREKFGRILQKKYVYGMFPLMLAFIFLTQTESKPSFMGDSDPIIFFITYSFYYMVVWQLLTSAVVVLKNAKSPHDSFTLFGKNEVITNSILMVPTLLIAMVLLQSTPTLGIVLDKNAEAKKEVLLTEWDLNEHIVKLKKDNPETYKNIKDKIFSLKLALGEVRFNTTRLIKHFCISVLILIIFQYLMGGWLYSYLKKKIPVKKTSS